MSLARRLTALEEQARVPSEAEVASMTDEELEALVAGHDYLDDLTDDELEALAAGGRMKRWRHR